jgi:hypothetical protein
LDLELCQRTGMAMDTLASHPQIRQQRSRAAGPRDSDRYEVARMLETPLHPEGDQDARRVFSCGQGYAEGGPMAATDEHRLFTEACLHGLRARLCDDVEPWTATCHRMSRRSHGRPPR